MLDTLRQRDFGLLWLAGLVSVAGDFVLTIALPLHVYRLTDSTLAVSAVLAAEFLPGVLLGSIAGVFVDRWDRKTTMVAVDLARAVLLLPLLVAPDRLEAVVAVAAVQGTAGLFFSPAENALLPTLVGEDRLVTANALNSLNNNIGVLFGPAIGALLYAQAGLTSVVVVDAVTFVGSALLIRRIAADGHPARDTLAVAVGSAWRRVVAEWRAGLLVVRRDRTLGVIFAALAMNGVAEGVFVTLGLSPLVLDVLGGTTAQVGWLNLAQGVFGIVGAVVVARIGTRLAWRWLFGCGLIGLGIADLGAVNARRLVGRGTPAVAVAMAWQVLAGPSLVAGNVGRQALVQTRTVDAFRGRVFGALDASQGLAMLVGFAVGGVLGDVVGIVPVLSGSVAVRILGGVLVFLLLPRADEPSRRSLP